MRDMVVDVIYTVLWKRSIRIISTKVDFMGASPQTPTARFARCLLSEPDGYDIYRDYLLVEIGL